MKFPTLSFPMTMQKENEGKEQKEEEKAIK